MSKKMKRVITLVVAILFLISILIGSFFLVKNSLDKAKEKEQIEKGYYPLNLKDNPSICNRWKEVIQHKRKALKCH